MIVTCKLEITNVLNEKHIVRFKFSIDKDADSNLIDRAIQNRLMNNDYLQTINKDKYIATNKIVDYSIINITKNEVIMMEYLY